MFYLIAGGLFFTSCPLSIENFYILVYVKSFIMNIATFFVSMLFSYYVLYFITLFSKRVRNDVKDRNKKLNKLRLKPIKSLKEQKAFITTKYPVRKESWGLVLLRVFVFIVIAVGFSYLFKFIGWEFNLWTAILLVFIVPIVINWILHFGNLQTKEDISIFFR